MPYRVVDKYPLQTIVVYDNVYTDMKNSNGRKKEWSMTRLDSNAHGILEAERDVMNEDLQPHETKYSLSDAVRSLKQKADKATL